MKQLGLLLLLAGFCTFIACNSGPQNAANAMSLSDVPEVGAKVENFKTFYERFHQDSAFQMERILFPLQGYKVMETDSQQVVAPHYYQPEEWELFRPINPGVDGLERIFPAADESLVIERLYVTTGTLRYEIERRYLLQDKGWMLIFYSGLRPAR